MNPVRKFPVEFFKKVQNKIHYAFTMWTNRRRSHLLVSRATRKKNSMGLTTFKGDKPHLHRRGCCEKTILTEKELRALDKSFSGYLDFAEASSRERNSL